MIKDPKGQSQRCLKVGEEIRRLLARMFQEEEFWHPDLSGFHVTITEVRVSPDFSHAKVFFLPLNKEDGKKIRTILKAEKKTIRKLLAPKLQIRIVPDLAFVLDESGAQAQVIEDLLRSTREE